MIFLNLPVRDLPRSRAFYEALGLTPNEPFSDDDTAALVLDESIVVRLRTRDGFSRLVGRTSDDVAGVTPVLPTLSVGTRAGVDDLVTRACDAGGEAWQPVRDGEAGYSRGFTDPDGHAWEIEWLEQLHVVN